MRVFVATVKAMESHKFDPKRKLVAITTVQNQQRDWVRLYTYEATKMANRSGRKGKRKNESSISSEAR
jgi:hypothetical protein